MCCYCCVERLKLDRSVIDHDAIAHRLKEDVVSCLHCSQYRVIHMLLQQRKSGKLFKKVANTVGSHKCFSLLLA